MSSNKFSNKALKLTVPVRELEENAVQRKVEETLKNDSENAYSIPGLMIKLFNVKLKEIEPRSSLWKKEHQALYAKITRHLKKLLSEKKIKSKIQGKSRVYWWIKKIPNVPRLPSLPNFPHNIKKKN